MHMEDLQTAHDAFIDPDVHVNCQVGSGYRPYCEEVRMCDLFKPFPGVSIAKQVQSLAGQWKRNHVLCYV